MLCKTQWSWDSQTWSHKMNLLNILSTSPHLQQMRIQILILGFEGLNHAYKPVRNHSLPAANDLEWFENQPLRILTFPINKYHQLKWYKSLWLWKWLPHRLSKRQSLSTTVLFGTMFTRTIVLNFNTYQMTPGFNPVTRKSELNRPWTSHFSFYFRISFDSNMIVSAKFSYKYPG